MDTLPVGQGIEAFTGTIWNVDALELLKLLPDASIDLILTDFPYSKTQAFYDKPVLDFTAIGKEMFRVIRQDGAVISTAAQPFTSKLVMLWEKHFQYEWIWRKTRKTNFLNAPYEPLSGHESILVFGHKRPKYYPQMIKGRKHGKRTSNSGDLYGGIETRPNVYDEYFYPDTVQEFAHDPEISNKGGLIHPNTKPLMLCDRNRLHQFRPPFHLWRQSFALCATFKGTLTET